MREVYQKFIGKRIRLISTNDQYTSLKYNDEGTISYVDDVCTIFVDWDNGSHLGLLPEVDRFEILYDGDFINLDNLGKEI